MGKHNGKARKTGLKVGATLTNRSTARTKQHIQDGRHTTDIGNPDRPNMQSIIERNDLDEFLAMAELQGREFAGERGTADIIVVSEGTVTALDSERSAEERAAIESRHVDKLVIPRRPPWEPGTTAEQLDDMERAMFLEWRRDLAMLEEQESLCLTPYEKNLEVWRQLWRVLERSDCVVQVLDARDPLRYFSEDLQSYAETINPNKRTLLLLNKSDLLSKGCRREWARYFEDQGVDYVFWSARSAIEQHKLAKQAKKLVDAGAVAVSVAGDAEEEDDDPTTRVVGIDELIHRLEGFASDCVASKAADGSRSADARLMVGLVGYPNVGKSSTINALYGSKKTSVAPTPGKTKHFQTLLLEGTNISLCDCPGLVLPKFAASKAEMVAAGVVPIDRLTDVIPPVTIVAKRAGRAQICRAYGLRLPAPASHEDPNRPPKPMEVISALALTRGWINGSGLPDETRAGRQLLKDFVDGKLVYLEWPPDTPEDLISHVPVVSSDADTAPAELPRLEAEDGSEVDAQHSSLAGEPSQGPSTSSMAAADLLDDGDLQMMKEVQISNKPRRAPHKFHKKTAKTKGDRGQIKDSGVEGFGVVYGKKGGIIRVGTK